MLSSLTTGTMMPLVPGRGRAYYQYSVSRERLPAGATRRRPGAPRQDLNDRIATAVLELDGQDLKVKRR